MAAVSAHCDCDKTNIASASADQHRVPQKRVRVLKAHKSQPQAQYHPTNTMKAKGYTPSKCLGSTLQGIL